MAGLLFDVNIPSKPLLANIQTCVGFAIAPLNQRVKVLGYGLYLDGTSNIEKPIKVQMARTTTGTLTPGGTAIKCDPGIDEIVQSIVGLSASVEPTLTPALVFKTFNIHPQLGYEFIYPLGQEEMLAGGTTLVFSALAVSPVNIVGYMKFEE